MRGLKSYAKNLLEDWIGKRKKVSRKRYENNKKHTVFVTGDVGKLGREVCKKLEKDYNIIGFDIAVDRRDNLSNYARLTRKMEGADYVVHLAAIPHPKRGGMDNYFTSNVCGTNNLLKAAEKNKIKKFVYISSTAYYGFNIRGKLKPQYFPIDETYPIASTPGLSDGGLDEYNQSKVMAEQLCAYYGTNKIFQVIVLRSAPANDKEKDYPPGFDWKNCSDYRRASFWANNPPENLALAVYLSIKSENEYFYEPFNVANNYTDSQIDISEFLRMNYPEVPIKIDLKDNPCLVDTRKIRSELGFTSVDEKQD